MTEEEMHIEQLMLEKLTGMICEEDARYLDALIERDEAAGRQWQKLKEDFEREQSQRYLRRLNAEDAWVQVKTGIAEKRQARRTAMRRLAIAASLILPLLIAALFFFRQEKKAPLLAEVQAADRNVKLYLQGARVINLSHYASSSGAVALNNVSLKVNKGNLSYVPLNNKVSHALNTLIIPPTVIYRLTLSDGTEVWLNSMSELKFPFTFAGDKREVYLNGEAYFRVAENADRPFIVHTPLTAVKVLGTEFNVNTYDSMQIKTALVEGKVSAWAADGENVLLKPGYEAVYSRDSGFGIRTFDNTGKLAWRQGVYYFQNASLEEMAAVVRRWYGDTLVFDEPAVASSRFTGAMLKDKPLTEFLDNLAITSPIRYTTKDGVIHLYTHR